MVDDSENNIKLFERRQARTAWDEENEKWWFSIIDVVAVRTDNDYQTGRNYWKIVKKRLKDQGNETVTNCNQLKMRSPDGKMRLYTPAQ
ncbi:MAG: hypothetical protein LBV40_06015 [Methanomicrobiales archaeon]|nr:hypothetical protein [Methanomicrobiales archaeon]